MIHKKKKEEIFQKHVINNEIFPTKLESNPIEKKKFDLNSKEK